MRPSFLTDQAAKLEQLLNWARVEWQGDECQYCNDKLLQVTAAVSVIKDDLKAIEECRPCEVALSEYCFGIDPSPDSHFLRGIRPDILKAVESYVLTGQRPGDFLTAVIENDLKKAFMTADEENRATLYNIVALFYNYCPDACWGSKAKLEEWQAHHGFKGIQEPV